MGIITDYELWYRVVLLCLALVLKVRHCFQLITKLWLTIIYLLTLHHLKWVKMSFNVLFLKMFFFLFLICWSLLSPLMRTLVLEIILAKYPTRSILRLGIMWKFKEGWWFCGFCRTGILAARMKLYNVFDRVVHLVQLTCCG